MKTDRGTFTMVFTTMCAHSTVPCTTEVLPPEAVLGGIRSSQCVGRM